MDILREMTRGSICLVAFGDERLWSFHADGNGDSEVKSLRSANEDLEGGNNKEQSVSRIICMYNSESLSLGAKIEGIFEGAFLPHRDSLFSLAFTAQSTGLRH